MERLLTIPEVAERLRVRPFRVYQLARDGLLPVIRMGAQVRVDRAQLEEWIRLGGAALPKSPRPGPESVRQGG